MEYKLLSEEEAWKHFRQRYDNSHNIVTAFDIYQDFLDTKITMGLLVPCDDEGRIVLEPLKEEDGKLEYDIKEMGIYLEAKKRVVFDYFFFSSVEGNNAIVTNAAIDIGFHKQINRSMDFITVRDLIGKVWLTPAKWSEIFLKTNFNLSDHE